MHGSIIKADNCEFPQKKMLMFKGNLDQKLFLYKQ